VRSRTLLALALLLGLLGLSTPVAVAAEEPSASPTAEPTPTPTPTATATATVTETATVTATPSAAPTSAFTVSDALLRWGINNETNNRGAAPGTFNLISAGRIGDPGAGGQLLTDASSGASWANGRPAGWSAQAGAVRVEKAQPDGTYAAATWAGTKTDRNGAALGGYATNTSFSDHQVVLSGGTGEVDPATGTATIRWTGSFTVVYYSGYSFFYVTDPVLTVEGGVGRLTATLGGYSSDMDDLSQWRAVPDRAGVVLADLGTVDLAQQLGFTATPAYLGVTVTGHDQNTGGSYTGSFPQSFVDFLGSVGTAAYWYSSGGSLDRNKVPLDLAVSYSAGSPILPAAPKTKATKKTTVRNTAKPAPTATATPTASPTTAAAVPVQPAGPALPDVAPAAADAPAAAAGVLAAAQPVGTTLPAQLQPVAATTTPETGWTPWTVGLLLLALAALVTASPHVLRRTSSKS
jgi:hypothetical protein